MQKTPDEEDIVTALFEKCRIPQRPVQLFTKQISKRMAPQQTIYKQQINLKTKNITNHYDWLLLNIKIFNSVEHLVVFNSLQEQSINENYKLYKYTLIIQLHNYKKIRKMSKTYDFCLNYFQNTLKASFINITGKELA